MPEVKIGDIIIGKYKIESFIAQGGFGDVFVAKRLGQDVHRALKVLRRDTPGMGEHLYEECGERFMLEAQLGAKFDHHNIIKALDYGRDGEMQVLVMEVAAGGNLAERISKNSTLTINEALQIATDIASGLAAIHALDVVHRDLKPSNILFDSQGNAKISDLGLAQLPGGVSLRSLDVSQISGNWHPGTRAYMSPEQESSTAYLKSSSDVFSLGVILFEILTGRNVKNLKPGIKASDFRADIPSWLDDLLIRMLSSDPVNRPSDGSEILQALQVGAANMQNAPAARISRETTIAPRNSLIVLALFFFCFLGIGVFYLAANYFSTLPFIRPSSQTAIISEAADSDGIVIEYLVSSSNSMLQILDGTSKREMVQNTLQQFWDNWPSTSDAPGTSLRVFGGRYNAADITNSCKDTELLSVPMKSPSGFSDLLNMSSARGLAPVAESVFMAVGDFQPGQKKAVVLIVDSGDTCSGDPCNWAATQYHDAGLQMPVYVMDLGSESNLNCLSQISGGKYFSIENNADLKAALEISLQEIVNGQFNGE